ncbi:MAG: hypothetical protein ACYDA5_00915 [Vulcanimicrobiaceae bacterium]
MRNVVLALLACAMLTGCSARAGMTVAQAIHLCRQGARNERVQTSGVVSTVLGTRVTRSGPHLGFIIATPGGKHAQRRLHVRVETNVGITGPIPLTRGDHVRIVGELACDDHVLHWTHHDPEGRDPGGYVLVDGRIYQ